MNQNSLKTPKARLRLDIGQKLEIIDFASKHVDDKNMTEIQIAEFF